MSEKPVHSRRRRLVDWINLTGAKKVHSLIDKVYKRKNLEMAWEKVKANRGSGGVDGQTLGAFEAQLNPQLELLQRELKEDTYQPLPVRQHPIPKRDKPGEHRMLGIPTIYDRVCQQALLNRLEPIFEPIFDDASFGYRRGRSPKDALRKVWKEIQSGSEWIVDADLRDFFGSADHEKLLTLVAQRVADSRVLRLIKAMLKAGSYSQGQLLPRETLNKPCLRGSKSSGANVSDPFSLFRPLRRFACDREPSLRLKPMPEATVFYAADTGSPERTPRTAGWHSSSVRDNAPSQIRTSASSPQTRAPPSSAPSTWCGSSPAPLRQYDS